MPRRPAFTLTELLVVLGILGVLLALILAAIQKVRHAADKLRCANNLHQIGTALHVYHNDYGRLPAGVTTPKKNEPFPRMTWQARLLPYIEKDALWRDTTETYRLSPLPFNNPPHTGFSTVVKLFTCPLDERLTTPQLTHNNRRPALTSYVGVQGTNLLARDGVLFKDSHIRLTDITDGTSNTIMVGERPPSADFWYGWWYASVGQFGSGSPDCVLGARELNPGGGFVWFLPQGPYHFQRGSLDNQADVFHFWSLHPGGAHFLFADKSVRFLTYSADAVLPALVTRKGGEVVELPD
jgi:prepilin-type N-terminal cleavage/methylation domain-containing protein